jgi:hypothetical protein
MTKRVFLVGFCYLVTSCTLFQSEKNPEAIARVGESYLYKSDIEDLIPTGISKKDSIQLVHNYMNRWASQELLKNAAEVNLNDSTKFNFEKLINQYKIDLYTKAYLDELVLRSVDTVISNDELKVYYDKNKNNFKTNDTLVRLRYINLNKENPRFETIKSKFLNIQKKDKKFWETYALQFKSFALNDSVWVTMNQVHEKLPFITQLNKSKYIVSGKIIEFADKEDIFLVKIRNVIGLNQIAPFEYLAPTLKEVILNKRKLQMFKKFEKDILIDAINEKKYEVY